MFKFTTLILAVFIALHYSNCEVDVFLPRGLFQMKPISIEECPDSGTKEYVLDMHLKRVNSKRLDIVGNATVAKPADKNLKIEYILDQWGNGGWRLNSYIFKQNYACESLRSFLGDMFTAMMGYCQEGECLKKKPTDKICPVIPGRYEAKGFDSKNLDSLNIPAAQVGKWRTTIRFINNKDNKLIGCFRITVNITPKRI